MLLLLIGFLVAGFLPPPSPSRSAESIARMYADHAPRIRLGLIFIVFGSAMMFPWAAAISVQLRRIEGSYSPMTYVQLLAGGCSALLFLVPCLVLEAASYRPTTRSADLTQALNDLGWIAFISAVSFALVENLAIAFAIFGDHRARPVFPRWAAYFNIWTAIVFLGGGVVVFFKTGPFAWNGAFAFWLPLSVFGAWFLVMTVLLLRAITEQEREEHVAAVPAAPTTVLQQA